LEAPSKKSRNDVSARILIVDDHEMVRRGVRSVLAHSRPHWEICGEAADGNQAIEATQALQPDVVIWTSPCRK
jgi:YesN/AraC family two-component response regulator